MKDRDSHYIHFQRRKDDDGKWWFQAYTWQYQPTYGDYGLAFFVVDIKESLSESSLRRFVEQCYPGIQYRQLPWINENGQLEDYQGCGNNGDAFYAQALAMTPGTIVESVSAHLYK